MRLPLFHRTPDAALLPPAASIYRDLEQRRRLHRYVLHVRSSQAFALNLFAPLDTTGVLTVLHHLDLDAVDAERPEFEYEPPPPGLAEARPSSPHQTQVDVVLRGRDRRGRRLVALIEVKLTETDFGTCSAYANPTNPRRDNCHSAGLFGADPTACYQLTNHGQGRRRYDSYLTGIPVQLPQSRHSDGGCLVRTGLNQPMRNLALAHLLLTEGHADRVVYALSAPTGHHAIWRRFHEARSAFPDTPSRTIADLPAEVVAAAHPDGGTALRARYPAPVLATGDTASTEATATPR